MITEKVCPICKNVLSDEEICSDCGWDKDRIFLTRDDASAWSNKESKEIKEAENAEFFIGTDYKLMLYKNKLYGIGDNSYGQICDEHTGRFRGRYFISDNVISAAAGKKYSVYVTHDGEVKIIGRGVLVDNFSGFSGATKVFTIGDDVFAILASDGRIYTFGNNTDEQIKENSTEMLYCKYNIPFCHSGVGGSYSVACASYSELQKNKSWTNDDIRRLKREYFSSRICGEEVYRKYEELTSSSDEYDIKWDIDINILSRECIECQEDPEIFDYYNDGTAYNRYYIVQFKGESSAVAYKTYNYITTPVLLEEEKVKKLLSNLACADISEANFTDDRDEMRLFAGRDYFLILNKGKLYGVGNNTCGQISDDITESYHEPHLIAENVISAAAGGTYTIYATKDGEVRLQGKGELTERFSGFNNVRQVFATSNDEFFIINHFDFVYGFGNNTDNNIETKKTFEVYKGSVKVSDLPVSHLYPYSMFDGTRVQNLSALQKSFETIAKGSAEYKEFISKYVYKNIHINTNWEEASRNGSDPSKPTIVKFTIYYSNNYIYRPVIITGYKAKKMLDNIQFQSAPLCETQNVRKAQYDRYNYEGLCLDIVGRVAIWDVRTDSWCHINKYSENICDIGLILNTAKLFDVQIQMTDIPVYIISKKNGEIFIENKASLISRADKLSDRLMSVFNYGKMTRLIKIPEN